MTPVRLEPAAPRFSVKRRATALPNRLNFFHASGDFCCLLITVANSLDPDQDRQIVSPDLDPNRLKLSVQFLEKVKFEKSQPMTTKA